MEIGSVVAAAAFQLRSFDATSATVGAAAIAAGAAWLWARLGRELSPRRVRAATCAFAGLFLVQAAVYAFHEWAEARLLPWHETLHAATEPYGPDGIYGVRFSVLLIAGPLAAVGWTLASPRIAAARARRAKPVARRFATGPIVM